MPRSPLFPGRRRPSRWPEPGAVALALAGAWVAVEGSDVRSQSAFRTGTTIVAVYATVQDAKGRLVAGVPQKAFTVLEDGTPVEVQAFSNEQQPLTVALLLDMSASIAGEFARVKGAAEQFVGQMAPGDRVRIGSFGSEILKTMKDAWMRLSCSST